MIREFADFNGNAPVTSDAVSACELKLRCQFPRDYVNFLNEMNGGEGFIGDESYLIVWPVEEIESNYVQYEVEKYCEKLLLIGSSGGGEAYAFDRRVNPWQVVQVPFVGMDYSLCEVVGNSFSDFIQALFWRGRVS